MLAALAAYLDSLDFGEWLPDAAGGTIYVNRVPDAPDALLSLFATGGFGDTGDFDEAHPNPTVQLRVRDTGAVGAETEAWALYDALNRLHNVTLDDGTHIIEARAMQEPTWLDRDTNRRTEYVFNVRFTIIRP